MKLVPQTLRKCQQLLLCHLCCNYVQVYPIYPAKLIKADGNIFSLNEFRYLIKDINFAMEDKIPIHNHCFDLVQVNGAYGKKIPQHKKIFPFMFWCNRMNCRQAGKSLFLLTLSGSAWKDLTATAVITTLLYLDFWLNLQAHTFRGMQEFNNF